MQWDQSSANLRTSIRAGHRGEGSGRHEVGRRETYDLVQVCLEAHYDLGDQGLSSSGLSLKCANKLLLFSGPRVSFTGQPYW